MKEPNYYYRLLKTFTYSDTFESLKSLQANIYNVLRETINNIKNIEIIYDY